LKIDISKKKNRKFTSMIFCPFCDAKEDDRLSGVDEEGKPVVLLMFHCPFFIKMSKENYGSDERIQAYLDNWRRREGETWLGNIGPVLKRRELRNIERSKNFPARRQGLLHN